MKNKILIILTLVSFKSLMSQPTNWSFNSVNSTIEIPFFNPMSFDKNEFYTVFAGYLDDPSNPYENYVIVNGIGYSNLINASSLNAFGNPPTTDRIHKIKLFDHRALMIAIVGGSFKIVVYDLQANTIDFSICISTALNDNFDAYLEGNYIYIASDKNPQSSFSLTFNDCQYNGNEQIYLTDKEGFILKYDMLTNQIIDDVKFDYDIADKSFIKGEDGYFYIAEELDNTNTLDLIVHRLDQNLNIIDSSNFIETLVLDNFFGNDKQIFEVPMLNVADSNGDYYTAVMAGKRSVILDNNLQVLTPSIFQPFANEDYLNNQMKSEGFIFYDDSFYFTGVPEDRFTPLTLFYTDNNIVGSWLKKIELNGLQSVAMRDWLYSSSMEEEVDQVERPIWLGMYINGNNICLVGYSHQSSELYLDGQQIADGAQGDNVCTIYEVNVDVNNVQNTGFEIESFSTSNVDSTPILEDNHILKFSGIPEDMLQSVVVDRIPGNNVLSFGSGNPLISPSFQTTHDFSNENFIYTYTLDTHNLDEDTNFFVSYIEQGTPETLRVNDFSSEDIFLFPNPSRNFIKIENNSLNIIDVKLYNLSGKRYDVSVNNNTIDVRNLNSGTYILVLKTNNNEYSKKLIKK